MKRKGKGSIPTGLSMVPSKLSKLLRKDKGQGKTKTRGGKGGRNASLKTEFLVDAKEGLLERPEETFGGEGMVIILITVIVSRVYSYMSKLIKFYKF